jgi:hypothetical protein
VAIVLNQGAEGKLKLLYDLSPWLEHTERAALSRTDEAGQSVELKSRGGSGVLESPRLKRLEMCVYEWKRPPLAVIKGR